MINEKLEQLYASKWETLSTALNQRGKLDYAHPMLLRVEPEKLEQADLRVMFFGQETKGWVTNDGVTSDFRRALDRYYEWFCDRNGCKGFNKKKKGGVRGFFKGFKFSEKEITRIYPDKKIYFVWNNISKIGRNQGKTGVNDEIRTIERKYFPVVAEELAIINPHIVIFFTGGRDYDIEFHFSGKKILDTNTRSVTKELGQVSHLKLPVNTLRMRHPASRGGFTTLLKEDAIAFFKKNII